MNFHGGSFCNIEVITKNNVNLVVTFLIDNKGYLTMHDDCKSKSDPFHRFGSE